MEHRLKAYIAFAYTDGQRLIDKLLASDAVFYIADTDGSEPKSGTNVVFWNGNRYRGSRLGVIAFHELGHTVIGGEFRDHINGTQRNGTGPLGNVDRTNQYRGFLGIDLRPNYKDDTGCYNTAGYPSTGC